MKVRGFTLIEMIVTIVIGSIIMLGIAAYLRLGAQGYSDSIARQRLQTQAQFVIEKMSREIRHAVPNSFFIDENEKNCLEFIPIAYSGFYSFSGDEIKFVVGFWDTPPVIHNGMKIVINPTRLSDLSSSSHSLRLDTLSVDNNVYTVSSVNPDGVKVASSSVSNRHFIYDLSSKVKYCFTGSEVQRNGVPIADHVVYSDDQTQSYFIYDDASLHRGGQVHLRLVFQQDGERSVYQQDVQVLNVP
ncbi:prepilin-type N-terminal cleavage/methylation domain-containing protein [Vibrio sp. STUT-A11]|uniref:PilW family protein n=1 Tax=Vibrio sp. STUT-A11 TaxID=2976236 RepID=UPI002231F41D|nr:prepilin-type N-terminal cleavage/methylation domain-containing protein [Vibrio sp. STUT-A11]BDR12331.1 MSHA biogenesis protein MshO [Vibrio sp. STUT-A11]